MSLSLVENRLRARSRNEPHEGGDGVAFDTVSRPDSAQVGRWLDERRKNRGEFMALMIDYDFAVPQPTSFDAIAEGILAVWADRYRQRTPDAN